MTKPILPPAFRRLVRPLVRPVARGLMVVAAAALLSGFTLFQAMFAPKAELWPRWRAFDAASTAVLDHGPWQEFLDAYVRAVPDGATRVDYGRVTDAHKRVIEDYVGRLGRVPVLRLARAEQRAYWINLYNALVVRLVLDHYPVESIQDIDISPGAFASGPWEAKLIEVDGEAVSLNDVEHRILRPIWKDPRLHYALNCASVGCPDLLATAFTAANTERLLDAAARAYVNHPRGARVEYGNLIASKIYGWFAEDFGGDEAGVIAHLRRFAAPPLAQALAETSSVAAYEYDWRLNDGGS